MLEKLKSIKKHKRTKKQIEKEHKILIITCFILLILISLKGIVLHMFSPYNNINNITIDSYVIEHQASNDYYEGDNNIAVPNTIGDYVINEEDQDIDITTDDTKRGINYYLKDIDIDFYSMKYKNPLEYNILKLNNISNNYELYKFLANKDTDSFKNHFYTLYFNILTNNYIQEKLYELETNQISNMYLLSGVYNGYYYEDNINELRVFCLYTDKEYCMEYKFADFTQEEVFNVLDTIVMN